MEYIYATGQMNFYLSQKGREKLENIKERMCDDHCRFPREAKMDGDIIIDDLVECSKCPLNELEEFFDEQRNRRTTNNI